MFVSTNFQGHCANAEALALQLYSICCYVSLLPPYFPAVGDVTVSGHAVTQKGRQAFKSTNWFCCCSHSYGLISNLPSDPYGTCHVPEVQPHGQMPRLQKHIILNILPFIVC